MTEWGIPEAIAHLDRVYARLEDIRKDIGRFFSEDDECRQDFEGDTLSANLTRVICKIEDTTSSIRYKLNRLLEEGAK